MMVLSVPSPQKTSKLGLCVGYIYHRFSKKPLLFEVNIQNLSWYQSNASGSGFLAFSVSNGIFCPSYIKYPINNIVCKTPSLSRPPKNHDLAFTVHWGGGCLREDLSSQARRAVELDVFSGHFWGNSSCININGILGCIKSYVYIYIMDKCYCNEIGLYYIWLWDLLVISQWWTQCAKIGKRWFLIGKSPN